MKVDKKMMAFFVASNIIEQLENAGIDLTIPEAILHNSYELPDYMWYETGASRLVIGSDDAEYVLKIALSKKYEPYNEHELEVYQKAVEAGLESHFGWCACYSEPIYNEDYYIPGIYIMERLDGDCETVSSAAWEFGFNHFCEENGYDKDSLDSPDLYNDVLYEEDCELDNLMDYFTNGWSIDEVAVFHKFLDNNRVNDLHCGNMLYRGNELVISDYAGWGWC